MEREGGGEGENDGGEKGEVIGDDKGRRVDGSSFAVELLHRRPKKRVNRE